MATSSSDKVGESQPQVKCFPPLFQLVYLSANHITIGVKTQTLKLVVYGKAFHKKNNLLVATHVFQHVSSRSRCHGVYLLLFYAIVSMIYYLSLKAS